jgi:hypothetical protein
MRPHAKTFQIESERSPEFQVSDSYFIGIRIRGGVEIKQSSQKIDLTKTRELFFQNLDEQEQKKQLEGKEDVISRLLQEKKVDIKIEYRR